MRIFGKYTKNEEKSWHDFLKIASVSHNKKMASIPGDAWNRKLMSEIYSISCIAQKTAVDEVYINCALLLRFTMASVLLSLIAHSYLTFFESASVIPQNTVEVIAQLDPFDISKVIHD